MSTVLRDLLLLSGAEPLPPGDRTLGHCLLETAQRLGTVTCQLLLDKVWQLLNHQQLCPVELAVAAGVDALRGPPWAAEARVGNPQHPISSKSP